jgi:hypothetical protein
MGAVDLWAGSMRAKKASGSFISSRKGLVAMRAEQSRLGYEELHMKLVAAKKVDEAMRRLCTVPGVGPVTAEAIMAFAPDLSTFASGRNFAASLAPGAPAAINGRQDAAGSVSNR